MRSQGDSVEPGASHTLGDDNLNRSFNQFLQITDQDKAMLARHRDALLANAANFVEHFYAYLRSFPATAQAINHYQADGGHVFRLAEKQTRHFHELLEARTDEASAENLIHIGEIHYRYKIEPVWIMGAYQLYLNHLRSSILRLEDLGAEESYTLESVLTKLLFRDMGLMLEGYWRASMTSLNEEKNKVADLQQQVSDLLANLPQVLWSVDITKNQPIYISPSAQKICDLDIEMPIPCLGWTHPEDRDQVKAAWSEALGGNKVTVESRVQAPGGELRWFRRRFHPFVDGRGRVVRVDGVMDDMTEAKMNLEHLHQLATTDSLTGLPNRILLNDRLTQALANAKRNSGTEVVLMLMDLNHFKEINDTLGHHAGDEILKRVAQRLPRVLREGDTIARLGGDEFAVLLSQTGNGREVSQTVARHLLECFAEPFWHAGHELYLGAGIGIAIYPHDGEDANALMSRADVAMYSAKHKDTGYVYYDPTHDPHTQQRLKLITDLRHALDRNEFTLHYQPQIDLSESSVVGVEALLRWNHPERGLVMPDDFIPFAERSGLIYPITEWVLRQAMLQCQAWHKAGLHFRISINISARLFQDQVLTDMLEEIFSVHCDLPLGYIEIEITENTLMTDFENGVNIVSRLKGMGIRVAIDDFGTGYSSLSYLQKLPIHAIKVDKSFVKDMASDINNECIVRSTIDLAHNLGYKVVAEGVEESSAIELLKKLGCDKAQGYHIGRPVAADQIAPWIEAGGWKIRKLQA